MQRFSEAGRKSVRPVTINMQMMDFMNESKEERRTRRIKMRMDVIKKSRRRRSRRSECMIKNIRTKLTPDFFENTDENTLDHLNYHLISLDSCIRTDESENASTCSSFRLKSKKKTSDHLKSLTLSRSMDSDLIVRGDVIVSVHAKSDKNPDIRNVWSTLWHGFIMCKPLCVITVWLASSFVGVVVWLRIDVVS